MPAGKLNKKEITRYTKKELLAICRKSGIKCNTKSSKAMLVAEVLRNKDLRSTLAVKGKRAMTDKQKSNLARFRFKKKAITPEEDDSAVVRKPVPVAALSKPNPKSRVKVNPTAANKVEAPCKAIEENVKAEVLLNKSIAVNTPSLPQPKKVGKDVKISGSTKIIEEEFRDDIEGKLLNTEYKFEKRTRDKASFLANKLHHQHTFADQLDQSGMPSHTKRLLGRIGENRKVMRIRNREFGESTNKTTDGPDRIVLNARQQKSEKERQGAELEATGKVRFDDEDERDAEEQTEIEREREEAGLSKIQKLIRLNDKLRDGKISNAQFKAEVGSVGKEGEPAPPSSDEVNAKLLEVLTKLNDAIEKKKDSSE